MTSAEPGAPEVHDRTSTGPAVPSEAQAAPPPVGRGEAVRRLVILAALYALPAVVVMRPVGDFDLWMNLRAGRWIVEHGAVPATDPFSAFGRGRPWVAYSWLFEVLVHGLHSRLGLAGVLLYRVVMAFAVLAAVHRLVARREPRFVRAVGLVGLAFLALAPLLNERTWLFTLLFTALTLDCVLDARAGRHDRLIWLLPAVFVVWANVHIQFVYGLFVLGLACVAPLIDRAVGLGEGAGHAARAGTREWGRLVAVTAACLAATFVNPYHVHLYTEIARYASQSGTFNLVLEHTSPAFRMPWEWAMPVLVGAAAFDLGRRRNLSVFEAALLGVTGYLALKSRRDVWFAVLASLAVLSTGVRRPVPAADRFELTWGRVSAVAGAILAVLAVTGLARGLSREGLEASVAESFPARAAAAIEERGLRGPLYNGYDWGSYLIWRLPGLPVAIDGRTDLHGPQRIRRFLDTGAGLRGWEHDPDLKAANTVLVDARSGLASLLRLDPRYDLVHEDPVAAVFVARPAVTVRRD